MLFKHLNGVQSCHAPTEEGPSMTEPLMLTADEAVTPIESERKLARVLGPSPAVILVLSCITPASRLFAAAQHSFHLRTAERKLFLDLRRSNQPGNSAYPEILQR